MRRSFLKCKSRKTARKYAPWAAVIAKADGGFWAFESMDDYRIWRNQK